MTELPSQPYESRHPSMAHSEVNRHMLEKADAIWERIKEESLLRGFFGSVAVQLTVQDGTIQHLRKTVEQSER